VLTGPARRLDGASFEARYRADPDPWAFHTAWYEQRRYAVSLAALPEPRYRRGLELGCANGALTRRLALRCAELHGLDISPTAVALAQQSCAGLDHVVLTAGAAPDDLPAGPFDLVVLSEVGYYFTPDGLDDLLAASAERLVAGGTLLSVHWTGSSTDHVLSGAFVETQVRAHPAWRTTVRHTDEHFVLGVHVRHGPDTDGFPATEAAAP
jgi:SAM-dependent methyltransferase